MKLRCYSDEKLQELLKDACLKESISWNEEKIVSESDEHVTPAERDEMVAYLLEVCERTDMAFSIETFSLTVTLIDRFLASYKVKSKYLECLAVSCLYIAAKVREEDDKISVTSEFLYDCNSKCSVSELLRMELMILTKFSWNVDDKTSADFLYIFHAILVNSYKTFTASQSTNQSTSFVNKWNLPSVNSPVINKLPAESAFPPVDLDILHLLEYKLKQVLCNHELATVFRPKVIALGLLKLQLQKSVDSKENANATAAKAMVDQVLRNVQQQARITDEVLAECINQTRSYLETIDADKTMMESYMNEYYSEMARKHRANSRLSVTLSTIAKHLTAIKEEDETEDQEIQSQQQQQQRILTQISNNYAPVDQSSMASNFNYSAEIDKHSSYAEKLLGLHRDQKRKLSENSITDEDYEFDCENMRH